MKQIEVFRGLLVRALRAMATFVNGLAVRLVSASLLTLSLSHNVAAAPGDLDPSFGSAGVITTDFASQNEDHATALALQPDGKIVVAGYTRQWNNPASFALARYNPDGSLDSGFGSGGKVTTDFGSARGDRARALAIQPDGKIVVAGDTATSVGDNFALARYNTDGSLDATFGNGGKVTTEFSGFDTVSTLGLQSDGKIVVVGTSRRGFSDFLLARYNADGALDASFGHGGRVISDFAGGDDAVSGLALQPDGKILVLGVIGAPPPPPGPPIPCRTFPFCFGLTGFGLGPSFPALVRYNPDGSLDATFGSGGKVTIDSGSSLALQPDGKIVVVTAFINNSAVPDFTLSRFNADGTLDATFGSGGKVTADYTGSWEDQVAALALLPDGKLLVALNSRRGLVVARYNLNGAPDPTFGNGGMATTDFRGVGFQASALALQPDGKIMVAGTTTPFRGSPDFALAR